MCNERMLQSNGSPRSSQVEINKRAALLPYIQQKAGVVYNLRVGVPAGRKRLVNVLVTSNVKLRVRSLHTLLEISYKCAVC